MAYSALLDANVLHPMSLCDLLLRLAEHGFYRPLWSSQILEETLRSIQRRRPDIPRDRLQRRVNLMDVAFPDASVKGHEEIAASLRAEMGGDAHVLAAAIIGRADALVTSNLADFPLSVSTRYEIHVQSPDEFLVHQWWLNPDLAARTLVEQSKGTKAPHYTPSELLENLGRLTPEFAKLAGESPELQRWL